MEHALTVSDFATPLWVKLERALEARLADLRLRNDAVMPEAERGKLLGQIHEVKAVLGLKSQVLSTVGDPGRRS